VEVENDLLGLVPLEELSSTKTERTFDFDKEYDFAIIEFDPEKQKLILIPESSSTK